VSYELDELLRQVSGEAEVHWKDETYDLALAGCLSEPERATFIARLCESARVGDTRAILTLGHLRAVEALPRLRAAAHAELPWAATARRALVLLGHGGEVVRQIAADAVGAPATMARIAAVLDLPRIGGPIAIAALDQALADEDYAVRGLAWTGLVEALDLGRHIRDPAGQLDASTELERLAALLSSDLAALVRLGVHGTREAIERLRAGETPSSLGIAWAPGPEPEVFGRLRLALVDPDAEFPVDEIARLSGVNRRWAETMLAFRLEAGDVRAPGALARLGATWAAPALVEVAGSAATPPELSAELIRSLRALGRSG
jgi:hypothetical protein